MKKRIVLITLVSMLFCGVVSAASIWGNYKGNAIVKVNVDGKQYKATDVPPIFFNGQTMIPISILKQLGISYSYDSKKLTANIKKSVQSQPVNEAEIRDSAVSWMKLYFSVANEYRNLNELLYQMDSQIYLTENAMSYVLGNAPSDTTQEIMGISQKGLEKLENDYNSHKQRISDTVKWGASNGVDMKKMEVAYDNLGKIIEYLKQIHSSTDSYNKTGKNKNYYDDYMYYVDKSSKEITNTKGIVYDEYEKMYQLMLNYK